MASQLRLNLSPPCWSQQQFAEQVDELYTDDSIGAYDRSY